MTFRQNSGRVLFGGEKKKKNCESLKVIINAVIINICFFVRVVVNVAVLLSLTQTHLAPGGSSVPPRSTFTPIWSACHLGTVLHVELFKKKLYLVVSFK